MEFSSWIPLRLGNNTGVPWGIPSLTRPRTLPKPAPELLDIKVENILGILDPGKVILIGRNLADVVHRNMEDLLTNDT